MPPKGKKATSKTVKRPRDSSDSQSADDTPNNVPHKPETPVIVISDEDSASSDQDEQQMREPVVNMIQDFQGDFTKSYLAKRKQFHQDLKTSIDTLCEKFVHTVETQQRERKLFYARYSKMFEPLFQQWEQDAIKVGQEEDSFANSSREYAETLFKTTVVQRAAIDEAKAISDQFLKNMQVLEDEHKILDAVEKNRLENEMEILRNKVVTENQQQDLAAIESCLHFLFSEDNEEDKL
ncbi:synaptonemal complex protein 3-like [Arvicanthis niloticus]|uniref:synaptonemal complex protein 3-like n=1 Tax=Arvicanthis niloticus TaxID=61156 RepID=UPI0014870D18|nr:X-linked lymphocyte-regulated protein 5C-like [Arvicanthis niloticus]XP_034341915.1 X-linked lymphocyte-regulated protein 5C-like [Arvicanthis niloticus]